MEDSDANGIHRDLGSRVGLFSGHGCQPIRSPPAGLALALFLFEGRMPAIDSMSAPLLPDAGWNLIQPLLPPSPHKPKRGGPRLPDRVGPQLSPRSVDLPARHPPERSQGGVREAAV